MRPVPLQTDNYSGEIWNPLFSRQLSPEQCPPAMDLMQGLWKLLGPSSLASQDASQVGAPGA